MKINFGILFKCYVLFVLSIFMLVCIMIIIETLTKNHDLLIFGGYIVCLFFQSLGYYTYKSVKKEMKQKRKKAKNIII